MLNEKPIFQGNSKGGRQERMDAGKEGDRKDRRQKRRDTGKEKRYRNRGGIQDRRDTGKGGTMWTQKFRHRLRS